jgi:hypothetical protein
MRASAASARLFRLSWRTGTGARYRGGTTLHDKQPLSTKMMQGKDDSRQVCTTVDVNAPNDRPYDKANVILTLLLETIINY